MLGPTFNSFNGFWDILGGVKVKSGLSWNADMWCIISCFQTWVSLMLRRGSRLWRSAVACQRGELWPILFCPPTPLILLMLKAASGQRLTVSLRHKLPASFLKYLPFVITALGSPYLLPAAQYCTLIQMLTLVNVDQAHNALSNYTTIAHTEAVALLLASWSLMTRQQVGGVRKNRTHDTWSVQPDNGSISDWCRWRIFSDLKWWKYPVFHKTQIYLGTLEGSQPSGWKSQKLKKDFKIQRHFLLFHILWRKFSGNFWLTISELMIYDRCCNLQCST